MFSKKELKLAYGVAVCLLVIGAVSYAAFPLKTPDEPWRLMFKVTAGNVPFDHKTHTSEFGYGLACEDCHHELLDDDSEPAQPCGDCHDPEEGDEEVLKRTESFHQQCAGCHEEYEAGPILEECALCHII